MIRTRWLSLAALVLVLGLLAPVWVSPADPAGGQAAAARFVPLSPTRVLDTRTAGSPVPDDGTIALQVGGVAGVPTDAVAVALNLTATESTGPGFVTVYPAGGSLPLVSNLNLTGAGQTVANAAVVSLGDGGGLMLHAQRATHLVVDVSGYFVAAPGGATEGRFTSLGPARVLDTRNGTGAPVGPVPADGTLKVQVTGRANVPAAGVSAVVLNLTATDAAAAGFVTAWPADQPRPLASNLNLPGAGSTVPNLVIVPVSATGQVAMYVQSTSHLVADVAGWFTDTSAPSSTDGLFVPLPPARILDSRSNQGIPYGRLVGDWRYDLAVAGQGGVAPSGAGAAIVNLTATQPTAPGFVTAWPAATAQPLASNLNVTDPGQTRANLAVTRLGHQGRISLYAQNPVHLVGDVAGWFTGAPASPEPGVDLEAPPPPAPPGGPGAVITPTGVIVPVIESFFGGFRVHTPCQNETVISQGTYLPTVDFLIDPGHGGSESGSVGSNGLAEKNLNLAIANRVADLLRARGFTAALTRSSDYRVPLITRGELATALRPLAFVSIHHNGAASLPSRSTPGTEIYYKHDSAESRRLGGILYEEIRGAMDRYDVAWVGTRRGVTARLKEPGVDLYGIHRYSPGVVSVITEALYLSNPPEARLIANPSVQDAEARAIVEGIMRWLTTDDAGSGYTPHFIDPVSTGTGGVPGCVDPRLQ